MAINFLPLGNAIDLVTSAVTDSITGNAITDAVLTAVLKTEGGTTLATSSALTHEGGGIYKGPFDISGVSLTLNTHYYLALAASNYAVQWKRLYRAEDRPLQGAGSVSVDTTPATSGLTAVNGIPVGDGAGVYAASKWGVVLQHGSTIQGYSTIALALAAAADGDTIQLGPGTFALGATGIDLSLGGTGTVSLRGCGKNVTTITSSLSGVSAPTASIVHPGLNGTTIADLTITSTAANTTFAIPIGNVVTTESAFTNLQIRNVIVNGGSDCILTHGSGTFSIFGYDSEFNSAFDTYQSSGTCTEQFWNCTFKVTAPTSGGNNLARTIVTSGTTTGLFVGCRFIVINTGSGNNTGVQAGSGHAITLLNCLVDETGAIGGGTLSDLKTLGSGTIQYLGCTFNPANVTGTGITALQQADVSATTVALASTAGGSTDGQLVNDSTQKAVRSYVNGIAGMGSRTLFTQTANVTVANTTAYTTLVGAGVGTPTMPAAYFVVGKTLRVKLYGFYSEALADATSLSLRFEMGTTTCAVVTVDPAGVAVGDQTTQGFTSEFIVTCRATGSSATMLTQGEIRCTTSGNAVLGSSHTSTAFSANTALALAIDVKAKWASGVTAADTITVTNLTIEELN